MNAVEIVNDEMGPIAYFINRDWQPDQTEFLTPDDFGVIMETKGLLMAAKILHLLYICN